MSFIVNNKNSIRAAIAIFIISTLIGALFGTAIPANKTKYKLVNGRQTGADTAGYYIIHNLKANALAYLGATNFGFTTAYSLVVNGLFIGGLMATVFASERISLLIIIAALLPHGIFELSGTLLAGAAGLKMPQVLIRHLSGGDFVTRQDIKDYFVLVTVSVVLIVIAGFIEANLTSIAMRWAG